MRSEFEEILLKGAELYHPGLSVDCVILGFHANQLKVLLLKVRQIDQWALPGGFVNKHEDVKDAASRLLLDRTGLKDIFLQQFYLFGDNSRNEASLNRERLEKQGLIGEEGHWFLQRFVTVGYYALVEFSKAIPRPDYISEACEWKDLHEVPELMLDHSEILQKALDTLRLQLNYQPIGLNLLPEKFTMPELQTLYETILGKKLDRRNFSRKMLGYGILRRLEERKGGVAHKAPFLYCFDPQQYQKALEEGLSGGW